MLDNVLNFTKGILIGISILIPGMSGGTTAILLNVYYDILLSFSEITAHFKKHFIFLSVICVGAVSGIILCSYPIKLLLESFKTEFYSFILGLISGTLPVFFVGFKHKPLKNSLFVIIGVIITLLINNLKFSENSILSMIIMSFLMAIALILPGISITNILIAFNCYNRLIRAITDFDFSFLLIIGLLLVFFVICTVKAINLLYKKYPVSINMLILGMVLVSLAQIAAESLFLSFSVKQFMFILSGLFFAAFFARISKSTG